MSTNNPPFDDPVDEIDEAALLAEIDAIDLDELIDMIDGTATETIYSDEFLAQGRAAAAVLRLAMEGKVPESRAQEVAQAWVDAALDEGERCDLLAGIVAEMEATSDPLDWRDLLIQALGLMSRQHLAATMAGDLREALQ